MVNFGLGGETKLKFDINEVLCVAVGLSASYTFLSYTNVEKSYKNAASGWAFKSIMGINPFIGIGFNGYSSQYWGKPQ